MIIADFSKKKKKNLVEGNKTQKLKKISYEGDLKEH